MSQHVRSHAEHSQFESLGITEFDYEEVERRLASLPLEAGENEYTRAATVFAEMLRWCFNDGPTTVAGLNAAFHKFLAASITIRPDLASGDSLSKLALMIGVTKQALYKQAMNFRDTFNVQLIQFRKDGSREKMRDARLKQVGSDGKVVGRNFKQDDEGQ